LNYRLSDFQKAALENWVKVYRGDLGIALADIINTDAFLEDFNDTYFCKLFDGVREDSEKDPIAFGHRIANFYIAKKINPRTKTIVFSNSLTFKEAHKIWEELHNIGIGGHIGNNWGVQTLNIVIKMVKCNGQPVAKISNSPGKGMCEDEGFVYYLKNVFNVKD
jgi:nicotinate phosphoribosyltransferase